MVLQVGLGAAEGDRVEVQVEAQGRVPQWGLGDHGGDQPFGHGPLGLIGVVSRVGDLGQHVEAGEQAGPLITAKIADVADAPLAQQLGDQQREHRLQGRDLLGAGQARGDDGVMQVQLQQQGDQEEEPGCLGGELPGLLQAAGPGVGDVGDERAIRGGFARLRRGLTMSRCGQSRALQETEQVAHVWGGAT